MTQNTDELRQNGHVARTKSLRFTPRAGIVKIVGVKRHTKGPVCKFWFHLVVFIVVKKLNTL